MKKMAPKKAPMKLTAASASRIREKAKRIMGDKDSAAGAAT
jgi:hypothetical protein